MERFPSHNEQLPFLRKIEGQIRGVQKMIEEGRYCVDILTQLHSIVGAIHRVEDSVFKRHLSGCVADAIKGRSDTERQKKIEEIINLIRRRR